ncbi:SDR family NAD(P)-dependent oxidoreductase [Nocardia sp. XZ_19_385]|uniref:SDR family NAD(P)-dependent oxidoreductase n=1 Tax=Nocardia sp. XZ_19_385 TaxID=2769488 RepID=UPI00188ED743|nr:SDR family NAD(P)-dependent oxidoreductase [Nocardia sp. XZ_19_385]
MSTFSSDARTVVVTGGDERLGYAAALRLAVDGANVIVHAQTEAEADEAIGRLVHDGALRARLCPVYADFRKLAEVDELGRLLATIPRLDALINAASSPATQRKNHTEDGHELTFQVNYLAPQRLTMALAKKIAAAQGRIVNVTSRLHLSGNVDYSDLDRSRGIYTPLAVYAQSKLALTMFGRSLAETGPAGLTVVNVDPADFEIDMPDNRIHREAPLDGPAALLTVLSAPETVVVNGGYYEGPEPAKSAALVRNSRTRARLATWTNQLTLAA